MQGIGHHPPGSIATGDPPPEFCRNCGHPAAFLVRMSELQAEYAARRKVLQAVRVGGDEAEIRAADSAASEVMGRILRFQSDGLSMLRTLFRWSEWSDSPEDCPIVGLRTAIEELRAELDALKSDTSERLDNLETVTAEAVLS